MKLGPTVYQSAVDEERRLTEEIDRLTELRRAVIKRKYVYRFSSMLESE